MCRGTIMSDPIEYVKNDIMDIFRGLNLRAGSALPPRVFRNHWMSYNPKQQDAFDTAVKALEDEGLIRTENENIFLTDKGEDAIY